VIERYSRRTRAWVEDRIEWAATTRAGRKWAGLTPRSQRAIAAAGAAGLVLLMVGGLALGAMVGSPEARAPASSSPWIAEVATPSTASASPTQTASLSESARPSEAASASPSGVLASVDCVAVGPAATADGRLYVACGLGTEASVIAIDLATDKVVETYPITRPDPPCQQACIPLHATALIVDGGLWIEWSDSEVQRVDLDSGEVTGEVSQARLVGDALGGIWVETASGLHGVSPDGPMPETGGTKYGAWSGYEVACGWIWIASAPGTYGYVSAFDQFSDGFREVPATAGYGSRVLGIGSTCWLARDAPPYGGEVELTRFNGECLGSQTMTLDALPFELGDTAWIRTNGAVSRLDMTTGSVSGPALPMPSSFGPQSTLVAASGQVWAADGDRFVRLAIVLDPTPGQATMPPFACASPSPTATPAAMSTTTPRHSYPPAPDLRPHPAVPPDAAPNRALGARLDRSCYTRATLLYEELVYLSLRRTRLGLFNSRNRRHVAIAIRADGRRVQVPAEDLGLVDLSLFGLLRSFELGIERVLVLITGSRRETGRRDKR
jgi:hypothetical protein